MTILNVDNTKMKKILIFIGIVSVFSLSCNKDPYMPKNPATHIELSSPNSSNIGGDNDGKPTLSSLRIMTYNIHICNPPSKPGQVDTMAVANAIKQGNPDIVFLQEVDNGTGRNGYRGDMALTLGRLTNMNAVFFSAIATGSGYYGPAMLSKYPMKNIRKYLLTKESEATEQRVLGTAIVDLPGVDSVLAAVTHLQHNSATNRVQQVKDIINHLGPQNLKTVFGADLNEFETTTTFMNIFDGTFNRTCVGGNCPKTFSAQNPQSVIDYLAYKPSSAFSVNSHAIIPEFYASDHLPIIAELKINR